MNARLAVVAAVLAAGSAAALPLAGRGGTAAPAPLARPGTLLPESAAALARAAEAAGGRRVLVLRGARGVPRTGEIGEAAQGADGWTLVAATPDGSGALATTLSRLATDAARAWSADSGLPAGIVDSLAFLDVKVVLVDAGGTFEVPRRPPEGSGLSQMPGAPFLRVTRAEPVVRVGGVLSDATVAATLLDTMRPAPAAILDPEDSLWGGAVTVEATSAGRYAFAWPAAAGVARGARITVDGAPATPVVGSTLLVLDLPAGRSRVEVSWTAADARGWVVIAAAAGLAAALVVLLLALRPALARE